MLRRVTNPLHQLLDPTTDAGRAVRVLGALAAAAAFVLISTSIMALDSLLPDGAGVRALQVGDIVPEDIRAPTSITYTSQILTEQRRASALESVSPVYDPPDPNVARQQIQLLRQILDYIDHIRRDPYGTLEQKTADLKHITALTLSDDIIQAILLMDDDTWRAVDGETVNVLERVMRESIRQSDLPQIIDTIPTQVSVRFDAQTSAVVVAIVQDLVRPNRMLNPTATEQARQLAAEAVLPETRSFERGQVVVRAGTRIEPADYEALFNLGLLDQADTRGLRVARSLFSSLLVLVGAGLYFSRSQPQLLQQPAMLLLIGSIFLIVLAGARVFSGNSQIYLYPTAALALIITVIASPEIAFVAIAALGLQTGLMLNGSFEVASLVAIGGMVGALTMRRSERLNQYFFAGAVIAVTNAVVVTIFNIESINTAERADLAVLILYALINGVIAAMAALAGIYLVTLIFNLPTSIKLVELSQPNHPLLQRLLREAPGTYQHSLQVANLSEQAANAIGANADLVRVAALYHDIGKMLNPVFFVENQVDGVNPHDVLKDPYRSAAIIISHVTDGERLAKQYRLPARIRDFILEHHGTTLVSYFYSQAVAQADDPDAVDEDLFTYPGPKPRSKETAIMMLADNCESTVRARKPANKNEIAEVVSEIFERRMRDGQLDESNLTLKDVETARAIFVEMLQAVFHPRINYPTAIGKTRSGTHELAETQSRLTGELARYYSGALQPELSDKADGTVPARTPETDAEAARAASLELPKLISDEDDDDAPLLEVPPLRRTRVNGVETGEQAAVPTGESDAQNGRHEVSPEAKTPAAPQEVAGRKDDANAEPQQEDQ